ncbi:MAG: carotenoid oxygenase family protein, partial [Kofleriaceae bacterium]
MCTPFTSEPVMVAAISPRGVDAIPSPALRARLWRDDLAREHGFEPLAVEGAMPAELRGTLYRNGPGLFGQFGKRYSHPFEGDGAVTAVRFGDGGVLGASRVTQTAGLLAERAAGELKYGFSLSWRRRFANMLRGRFKNTANTSVMIWQGRLFGMMEGAKPTELDPQDLEMIGETDLGGMIVGAFSAHPHRVASRAASYNFGLEYGKTTRLHMYELPDQGAARRIGSLALQGPAMLHDFIATDTHLIFFVPPSRVHVPRMLLQLGRFDDLFCWRPELGTEIICVPIDRPDEVVRFTTDAFYQWHFTNAFDRGGELVIDYVRYPSFDSFYAIGAYARGDNPPALSGGQAHRATISLATRTLRSEPLFDDSCEFPTVAPGREGREHGLSYFALGDNAIGKLDHATGRLSTRPSGEDVSTEPLFVARPGAIAEDDGWLLALCHDETSDRACVAVYDAKRLDGPIARAWFDHQIPITFHGTFLGS